MSMTLPYAVAVLGVPFHSVTIDEAVDFIEDKIDEGGFHQIATANVDFLMNSLRDKSLQEILFSCDLVVPDGMPVLWAARLLGGSLKERVCGVDLVPQLAGLCVRRHFSMFLLGASDKVSARAAENLKQRFPGLRIAGRYSPPVQPLEKMNHEEILDRIAQAKPDILLVAFGNPKQEKWLAMHRDRLNVPACIGVGGSLDFVAGAVPRAPRWMQSTGLEWLYRMGKEPKRLAQRYLHDAIGLALHVPSQLFATAMQPRHKTKSGIFIDHTNNTSVISIYGDFTGSLVSEFQSLSGAAIASGMNLVLNLSQTTYLGADSLGSLIQVASAMRQSHQQLWLAEMRPHLLRMLQSAHLNKHFMTTTSVDDALYRTAKAEQNSLARPIGIQGASRMASNTVQVRLELLQDICQKIAVNTPAMQHAEYSSAPPSGQSYAFRTSLS
jgi:N-acetylglucosaminyldiphosphoundecaprenol N-acetyl-beta-D-mannosaminyltransferase